MAQMSGMDKYKFRRALEQIEEAEGRGTDLVSVYIPPERRIFDVTNYLRAELSQSANIKSASTRKHVTQAIESAMQRLKAYRMPPPNGLVIFTGHKQIGADQTQMVTFVLEPPEPVTSFIYRCDSKFYTAPLHEMLAEKDVYGLLVIDWSEATLGVLRGKRIEVIKNLQSQVPSKHRMGGQSARRFERGHDIAVHEWYKKIGELSTEAFLNRPETRGSSWRARLFEGRVRNGRLRSSRAEKKDHPDLPRRRLHGRVRPAGARREFPRDPQRPRPDAGEDVRPTPDGGDPEGGWRPGGLRRGTGPECPPARRGGHPPGLRGAAESP